MQKNTMDRIALALVVLGALNWLLVGVFNFDLVATLFGGTNALVSKIIYSVIGLSGIYSSSLFFREEAQVKD